MLIIAVILGYFLGAIPFGYLVGKLKGINIMQEGSGNIGFTNTWRVMGFQYGILVLICDVSKGYLSSMFGFMLAGEWGALLGGVACILGHTFSIFLRFKGGKGVACGAGFLLYISPITFVLCAICLCLIILFTKYMSLGSITAAALCPFVLFFTNAPLIYVFGFAICCTYVIWMHRSNIKRLLSGNENKIGHKK